jgi:uncharacterized Fe-S cluster protein YjdI
MLLLRKPWCAEDESKERREEKFIKSGPSEGTSRRFA